MLKYFIEALMMSRQSSMLTALEGTFLKGITYPQAYVHMVVWIVNVELMLQLIYKNLKIVKRWGNDCA